MFNINTNINININISINVQHQHQHSTCMNIFCRRTLLSLGVNSASGSASPWTSWPVSGVSGKSKNR